MTSLVENNDNKRNETEQKKEGKPNTERNE